MYIFYLTSEQEIDDKIINHIFMFLFSGTVAFNELQIDNGERKHLKENLYSSSGSSVPYMLILRNSLLNLCLSLVTLWNDRFSKTSIVTESV